MATARQAGSSARSGRRAYWQRQVEAHRRSGLTQADFCAQKGLRKGTLSFWKWKLAREARSAPRPDAPRPRRTRMRPVNPTRGLRAIEEDPT
jgi:hypothetical protein